MQTTCQLLGTKEPRIHAVCLKFIIVLIIIIISISCSGCFKAPLVPEDEYPMGTQEYYIFPHFKWGYLPNISTTLNEYNK